MRRPARILLNAATAASVALCIAAWVLWARSYWRWDDVQWARHVRETGLALGERGCTPP